MFVPSLGSGTVFDPGGVANVGQGVVSGGSRRAAGENLEGDIGKCGQRETEELRAMWTTCDIALC